MKNETNERKNSVSKISFWLVVIGFAFFINPVPFGLDIIPDVIGCVFIFFGLTQLAYFDGSVEDARKYALYLFFVEFLHLLLMRSMFLTEISMNRLLAVTGFSIVQGFIYLIFFKKLFSGISYFSMRNNCNKTLADSDGVAFLSYLAFFVRIGATLLPELISLVEWHLHSTVDLDKFDAISAFVDIKPVIVVLLSLITLVTSVIWFVSTVKLLKIFDNESGEMLDLRYEAEYTSRPEKVIPKKLKRGSYAVYVALFFALDIKFDGVRIIPACAMFLILFFAMLLFKGISEFKSVKRLAIPAFLFLLVSEIYRSVLTPNDAIIIYETDIKIVIIGSLLALFTLVVCLLCVRTFFIETRNMTVDLGIQQPLMTLAWVSYCVSMILWAIGFAIPYFYASIHTPKFIATVIFIWQTVKIFEQINEDQIRKTELYGE